MAEFKTNSKSPRVDFGPNASGRFDVFRHKKMIFLKK